MLKRTMITPDILEVHEVIHGFQKNEEHYFYTNIRTWEDMTNPQATRQTANFRAVRKMTSSAINWCLHYHLPKATGNEHNLIITTVVNLDTEEEQTFFLSPWEALISAAILADKQSCGLTNELTRERYAKKIVVGDKTASIDTLAGVLSVKNTQHPYPRNSVIRSRLSWTRTRVVGYDQKAQMYVCEGNIAVPYDYADLVLLPYEI